jgi:phosphate:Na+ symporter
MDWIALISRLVGGVGLFLLGMGLMTDGLRLAAGATLERILARSTRTPWRGLSTGMLVTALVQSSSAVTVATIGFVNAGLLTLTTSLWVLFGANVGTTMTGWLVALVGLRFKIELLALPLIGLGMLLRLTGAHTRRAAVGMALAGFGVLFLGIEMLQSGFAHVPTDVPLPPGVGLLNLLSLVFLGVLLTVLMQSSSAALAIALTAAQSGLIVAEGAAAVVIGANIGTTVTALIAVIGATPNAKRAAMAHVLFNLLTGTVALMLLPVLVAGLQVWNEWLGMSSLPAAQLALFHTTFNVLGVALIWPLAPRMARFLRARFRTAEEDEAQPRYLDKTLLAVPALALTALERELRRMGAVSMRMLRRAEMTEHGVQAELEQDARVVMQLNQAIAGFIAQLGHAAMTTESASRLPQLLRINRHYETTAEVVLEANAALRGLPLFMQEPEAAGIWRHEMLTLLRMADPQGDAVDAQVLLEQLHDHEAAYQAYKDAVLALGAAGVVEVHALNQRLHAASAVRRASEQMAHAAQLLAVLRPEPLLSEPEKMADDTESAP